MSTPANTQSFLFLPVVVVVMVVVMEEFYSFLFFICLFGWFLLSLSQICCLRRLTSAFLILCSFSVSVKNMEGLSHWREHLKLDSLQLGLQTKPSKIYAANEHSLEVWTSRILTYVENERKGRETNWWLMILLIIPMNAESSARYISLKSYFIRLTERANK